MSTLSVIIPTYNCAEHIAAAVESVLCQSYQDYEIIVVDDGSHDDTGHILSRYADRIRYVYQENSGGPARPRNVGIALAEGKYVAFLDADDRMLPDKLKHAVEFLDSHPYLGLVFSDFVKQTAGHPPAICSFLVTYRQFHQLEKRAAGNERFVVPHAAAFDTLLIQNYIGTSSVVCPRAILAKIGTFDESVSAGGLDDRDLWLRIARSYDLGYVNRVDHICLDRTSSVSKRPLLPTLSRIAVLERYIHEAHSHSARRAARMAIATNWLDAGYYHRTTKSYCAAFHAYGQALLLGDTWRASKGLLKALLVACGLRVPRKNVSRRGSV